MKSKIKVTNKEKEIKFLLAENFGNFVYHIFAIYSSVIFIARRKVCVGNNIFFLINREGYKLKSIWDWIGKFWVEESLNSCS